MGNGPEEQRCPGGLHIIQEGNLNGTGAGCPNVPKDEPEGKKTDLSEQRIWLEFSKNPRSLWPLEQGLGQGTQEDYIHFMKFSGGKLEEPKLKWKYSWLWM